jgi:hypothetical protein
VSRADAFKADNTKYNWSGITTSKKRANPDHHVVLRHCRGHFECRNKKCPFVLLLEGAANISHGDTAACSECNAEMVKVPCSAKKATVMDGEGKQVTNMWYVKNIFRSWK